MTTFKNRIQRIKQSTLEKPYIFIFFGVLLGYFLLNAIINKTYVTAPTLFSSYNLSFAIPYVILSILVGILVALSISLSIFKIKEYKLIYGAGGLTITGIFAGLLGGACPGCFVGLFPAVVGLLG